jgi:uncharacterized Zn finger protein (UPF0148 family)
LNFWHRLLNPNCPDCALALHESQYCKSCETLKQTVARLEDENRRLLNHLLAPKPIILEHSEHEELEPIRPAHVSWNARRQMLEAEDRAKAKILRTQKLEDEILKSNAAGGLKEVPAKGGLV